MSKYGLFLFEKIDFAEHVKQLSVVPVLFIPGNGGSYKLVRSSDAESSRACQAGLVEATFYQEATCLPSEQDLDGFWFFYFLEGCRPCSTTASAFASLPQIKEVVVKTWISCLCAFHFDLKHGLLAVKYLTDTAYVSLVYRSILTYALV